MILKDFEKGGFPIGRLSPVLAVLPGGEVAVAYNNFTLKSILDRNSVTLLMGVWPGKHKTGLFFLDPSCYGKFAPPQTDEDIDNAVEIVVHYIADKFDRIDYTPYSKDGIATPVVSKSAETLDYLANSGLKYRTVREQ